MECYVYIRYGIPKTYQDLRSRGDYSCHTNSDGRGTITGSLIRFSTVCALTIVDDVEQGCKTVKKQVLRTAWVWNNQISISIQNVLW